MPAGRLGIHESAMRPWTFPVALSLLCATEASGQALSALEPLALPVRDGRVSLSAQDRGLSLGAELAVRDSEERARVLPQIKSAFTAGRVFGIETRVGLPDLNGDIGAGRATVATKLRLRPDIAMIRGVDTQIRQAGNGTSTDTSIDFESPVSFLDQLEGRIRENPGGGSTYSFKLGFSNARWAGDTGDGRFSSEAIIEQTERAGHEDAHRLGFQTVLSGSRRNAAGVPFRRGTEAYKLVLGVEQRYVGPREWTAASLALNQSWLVRPMATLDLSVKMSHNGAVTRKSLEIAWQAGF